MRWLRYGPAAVLALGALFGTGAAFSDGTIPFFGDSTTAPSVEAGRPGPYASAQEFDGGGDGGLGGADDRGRPVRRSQSRRRRRHGGPLERCEQRRLVRAAAAARAECADRDDGQLAPPRRQPVRRGSRRSGRSGERDRPPRAAVGG